MRFLTCSLLVVVALSLTAAKLNISEPQAITCGVLDDLAFEKLPSDSKVIGGPSRYTISKKTLEFLKKYQGKTIEVTSDGSIAIEETAPGEKPLEDK